MKEQTYYIAYVKGMENKWKFLCIKTKEGYQILEDLNKMKINHGNLNGHFVRNIEYKFRKATDEEVALGLALKI